MLPACYPMTQAWPPWWMHGPTRPRRSRPASWPNPNGRPNSDVLRPMFNAKDVTQRPRRTWNIDFGLSMLLEEAAGCDLPFDHVKKVVYPLRINHREARQSRYWWLFARPCPDMRQALAGLSRFLVTPRVSKHRVFDWLTPEILCDSALVVFGRSDDYFFGVLHSRAHEVWARRLGTQVRERESGFRYTPFTCFETFPFLVRTKARMRLLTDLHQTITRLGVVLVWLEVASCRV
jgi:hypothetical protein